MEEQRACALPENLTGDGNTIAGPSGADIDSPSNSIAGPSSAGIDSSPTSALPPNPSDIAGDGCKRKRHAEKKDKKAKKTPVLYSAPPIPAGILRNPQESSGILRNGTGIRRNPQESSGIRRNGTGIELKSSGMSVHANVCIYVHCDLKNINTFS